MIISCKHIFYQHAWFAPEMNITRVALLNEHFPTIRHLHNVKVLDDLR